MSLIAHDLSVQEIALCLGVDVSSVEAALDTARFDGVIRPVGGEPAEAARMVTTLAGDVVAEVHATVARYLLRSGPERLSTAIHHAQMALRLRADTGLLALMDHMAQTCLAVGDYESARECLECTNELATTDSPSVRAQRLRTLAVAFDGLGLVTEAHTHLAAAFQMADYDGATDLAVLAAVDYVFPVDWYAGDRRATAQLQRAEELADTDEQIVQLRAARAMAEMRIPVPTGDDLQVAWVTRPSVAQPLADDALEKSVGCSDTTRLVALLGWRTTHRAPEFLERRRSVSAEACDLAQRLRHPGRMVDAAVMLGVDSLESGDRSGLEHVVAVLRWIADVDSNPRLAWHFHTAAAGAAHLDGDHDKAKVHRDQARVLGLSVGIPGWFGAEHVLFGQELFARADPDEIRLRLFDESGVAMLNPLATVVMGLGCSYIGEGQRAEDLLRRAFRQFDRESSWLLCHTRASELAMRIGAGDLVDEIWTALEPWYDRVAVDSQAWYCDGPVSGWLALLAHHRGDLAACRRYLQGAVRVARSLGDVRTLSRMTQLSDETGIPLGAQDRSDRDLTGRERLVLQRVVDGWNNPQIAESMAFSRSTIRNELSLIYRKLGVSNRLEAADHAVRFGLCQPLTGVDTGNDTGNDTALSARPSL